MTSRARGPKSTESLCEAPPFSCMTTRRTEPRSASEERSRSTPAARILPICCCLSFHPNLRGVPMNIQRREMIARTAAAWAVAALQPWRSVHAQAAWPSRTIKFVNLGPPGTAPDTYNRVYAERLSKALNVPVIIENRPGAAGNIASDVVAKAPSDGYTLLYTVSSAFTVNPWIYSKLSFDPEKEFRPVSPLLSQGAFIVANNDTPFKTVKEL